MALVTTIEMRFLQVCVPILGDQGELEIPPRGTFEDQLVYSHTWQTYRDFSPITASDVSDSYDSPGDDDIPDLS